jgi:ureidoacrylate peracid hydrolase
MTTAALIIDMQNGFVHPAGSTTAMGRGLPGIEHVVAETKGLLGAVRALDWPVIYTRHQFRPDFLDCPPKLKAMFPPDSTPLVAGSWDAAVTDDLMPLDGDTLVDKNRFDAFLFTDLEVVLRALGITRLLVAGVVTNVCVESTVRSAAQRDFDVTVASDCTAAADGFHQPALRGMEAVFASVSGWRQAAERLAS